jgi:soluble lytic murein transglycosylase-like protein
MSKKNGLDPVLVYSVMKQESGFKLDAGSPVGASGLMQVMPDHFTKPAKKTDKGAYYSKMFGAYRVKTKDYNNRFDAYINVTYGTGILADCLRDAGGNKKKALSLYNSGSENGYLSIKETKGYVNNIIAHVNKLKGA